MIIKDKPDAILVGDIHARDDQPICRTDDFLETQWYKFCWLLELWDSLGKPMVIQTGDLFHRWKSSPRIINTVLECLPPMITIPGNPGKHNQFGDRDALYTVHLANKGWRVLTESEEYIDVCLWGEEPTESSAHNSILLTHRSIIDGPSMFDGEHGLNFLKRIKGYSLIVSGHNHKPMVFVTGTPRNPRRLVNPGSFTRQSANEDHAPRVYLWYTEENRMEPVYVPIEEGVISRQHIDSSKDRDDRIAAFVESLAKESSGPSTTSFKDNMDKALSSKNLRQPVKQRIMEAMGDEY